MGSVYYIPMADRKIRPSQITYTTLGQHRGNKRLWLEGLRLNDMGFEPGASVDFRVIPEFCAATLEVTKNPTRNTVSSRKRKGGDQVIPIVDINSQKLSDLFDGIDLVRVMYYKNRLLLQAHSNEMNAMTAIEDLEINTAAKRLTMGVIGVGGGVFSSAIKEGLEATGIDLETSWVIDIEQKYLESAMKNSKAISDKTIIVNGDASHVESNLLTPINIFLISNACTGFSSAGRAKNQLDNPEAHKDSGLMILKTLEIIERYMPPVIWHENVVAFNSSASAALLVGKLQSLGYDIQSGIYGGEMGTLEDRKRSILVATHKSLKFDLENHLVPVMEKEAKLQDVMDDIPLDDPSWKTYSYLKDKAVRDIEAGKGFRLQHLTGEESKVGVIGAGMAKARSTEPFFIHPTNPDLLRLPTVAEHAAFMKIPIGLVDGLSKTVAHEVLGQSGSYALVKAIGVMTGKELNAKFNNEPFIVEKNHLNVERAIRLTADEPDDSALDDDMVGMDVDDQDEGQEDSSENNKTLSLF